MIVENQKISRPMENEEEGEGEREEERLRA